MNRPRNKVPRNLAALVKAQARRRCGYCLTSETLIGMPMELEHLKPQIAGGATIEINLWLSCRRCNGFKGTLTEADDPQTGEQTEIFNPREQSWKEHFAWSEDGTEIIGQTPCGRAIVTALKMNNPEIVVARRRWVSVGWWPPSE